MKILFLQDKIMAQEFDVIVIGGGPGGYVAAIRASQLGMSTAIVEKDKLGGVCLNWGCIPSKALLKSAEVMNLVKRGDEFGIKIEKFSVNITKIVSRSRQAAVRMSKGVEYLIRHNKIHHFEGTGILKSSTVVEISGPERDRHKGKKAETISGKHIIIATGGRPQSLPGMEFDGENIISSKEAMIPKKLPDSITIIGGGAIGVEFAYFYASFGVEVNIVEMLPQLLPNEDSEISAVLEKSFKKRKINILTGASVEKAVISKTGKRSVELKIKKEDETIDLKSEIVLVAVGVRPNTDSIGLMEIGVEMDRGFILVDEHYQTSVAGIYAVGDCIGGLLLAHTASAEGIACIESIAGISKSTVDDNNTPRCTYCQPQVASIGLTEEKARDAGYELKIGKYPFRANGKSVAVGETEGLVKLVFDAKYGDLLGAHIVGHDATEMIAEIGIAKNLDATYMEILKTVHAHPTVSESVMEAAGNAFGEAIHI